MINNEEFERALINDDENKILFFLSEIVKKIWMEHPDYEDWKSIAVYHAWSKRSLWNKEKGKAFSYFYRILQLRVLYEFRAFKQKQVELLPLDESFEYMQDFGDQPDIRAYNNCIVSQDELKEYINKYIGNRVHNKANIRMAVKNFIKEKM